jgi:hypothetical protein
MRHNGGNDIRKKKNTEEQKNSFRKLIVAFENKNPDSNGRERNGNVFADAENIHASGNTRKFRRRIADIGNEKKNENIKCDADTETFPY